MSINVTTHVSEQIILRARAPGKVILSGEHSVVYGANALAVAVQEYTTVNFLPVSHSRVINTIFSGISTGVSYPINALSKLKHHLDERFEKYSQGKLPVQSILSHPNDLVMYALMSLLHQLPSRKTLARFAPNSGILRSDSTIPNGAGMGSSASVIAATLVLYENILEKPLTTKQRFEMVRFCERLQHGKGSAIDAATVTYGGVNRVHAQQPETIHIQLNDHWYWLNTGTPTSSTGKCVQFVKNYHGTNTICWQNFNTVTLSLEHALQQNTCPIDSIRENHQLLNHIGVVPKTAARLIAEIEKIGGAAKISGAGAVEGEKAGLVLMYLPDINIRTIIDQLNHTTHNYIKSWSKLAVDELGAICLPQPNIAT